MVCSYFLQKDRCVVIVDFQKSIEIFLCTADWLSVNRPLLNMKGAVIDYNDNNNNWVPGAARLLGKTRFQQLVLTHSEAGEKETLNSNVVEKCHWPGPHGECQYCLAASNNSFVKSLCAELLFSPFG